MLARTLQTVIDTIYPPMCIACDDRVADAPGLCGACFGSVTVLSGLLCDKCGTPLPGTSDEAELCDTCLTLVRPWTQGRAALLYDGPARALILRLKHADRTEIARPVARFLARAVAPILPQEPLLVPVPLHWRRLLARRYNQSALLVHELARLIEAQVAPVALERPTATVSLDGLTREARLSLLAGKVRAHPKHGAALMGRNVLLIDDVMTTGATLAACADAALGAGARSVRVAVVARVVQDA